MVLVWREITKRTPSPLLSTSLLEIYHISKRYISLSCHPYLFSIPCLNPWCIWWSLLKVWNLDRFINHSCGGYRGHYAMSWRKSPQIFFWGKCLINRKSDNILFGLEYFFYDQNTKHGFGCKTSKYET